MGTTTNTQRDELALFLANHDTTTGNFSSRFTAYEGRADAILAAGYRKPRTITTVEELDALPMGAAILDTLRAVWVNDGDTVAPWASLGEGNLEGGPIWVSAEDIALPATVLYAPEALQ